MIKFLGFIIIITSSTMIGFDFASKYTNRTSEIRSLINVFEILRNEIGFSNCIITEALGRASNVKNKNIKKMINFMRENIREKNVNLYDSFKSYIVNNNDLALDNRCIDDIERFFISFGIGDREDEINNIESYIEKMKFNLGIAIEEEKKYVKLLRTSGVLSGLLIAIVLA